MGFDLTSVLFYVNCFVLSLIVTYAAWVKVRVVLLRQRLFEIRDGLFDEVLLLGALDDPGYRDARTRMNANIRFVPALSIPVMYFLGNSYDGDGVPVVHSDNPDVQKAIDRARESMHRAIYRYVMRYTASGLLLSILLIALPRNRSKRRVIEGMEQRLSDEVVAAV